VASPESSLQFQVNHKQVCAGMRQIPRLSLACILRPNRRRDRAALTPRKMEGNFDL
jgi:hypothetical protein